MAQAWNRRQFLELGTAAGLALGGGTLRAQESQAQPSVPSTAPSERVRVGVMGLHGRGSALAREFTARPDVDVAYLCDVDQQVLEKAMASQAGQGARTPQAVGDFRRILDDRHIDALVVAAPNHWHGPATILACQAAKHVYVEKPCCHNPQEGEWMVQVARKFHRVVTVGTQRRSRPLYMQAIARLREGEIGKLHFAHTWYNNRRGSIGRGHETAPPPGLDYELWQGPAPRRPYRDNVVHYNWHWRWHWGNGELGNNGVHSLDVGRWGLGVDYPTRVSSAGLRARFDDDQETPDTHVVTFTFGTCCLTWQGLSWSPYGPAATQFGASFHGESGSMVLLDSGAAILDLQNKTRATIPAAGGDGEHIADFVDAIRTGRRPHADIEEGHQSTLLCHLGNIAHRVGRSLSTDSRTGRIEGDAEALALWGREYDKAWAPAV